MKLEDKITATINTLLYIIQKLGGEGDFHKVFKVFYFADQKHLTRYGSLITDDKYIAMNNGPVPSMAYDILKALRGEGLLTDYKKKFEPYFELESSYIARAKTEPDLDELSESEVACIDEAIIENQDINFQKLTEKFHDTAWHKTSQDFEMDINEIAIAGGANEAMIKYINETRENRQAAFE